jgi:uncharacterized membrane protein
MLDQMVLCGALALVGALLYYLPVMKGPDAFFGIPVSDEFYRGPVARMYLRAYWFLTALLVAGAISFLLGAPGKGLATPGTVLAAMLTAILGPMVPLVVIWRRLRSYEAKPATPEGLSEEPPGGKWRYVSPWVEVLLAAVLLMLVALTVWQYPNLPGRIPIHWNAAGQADGWAPRSPLPLAALLLMLGWMHVMLLTLLIGMAQTRVRLPAQRVEEYREARERYMRLWVHALNALRFSVVLIFGGIIWASLFGIERQAEGAAPPGMVLVWVATGFIFVALGWLVVKGLAVRREMREIAGPGSLESTAPTEGWVGGMIYYNRNDPAVWVEKRIGIGWTLNFAQPFAWVIMGLVIVVPLGIVVAMLLGAGK